MSKRHVFIETKCLGLAAGVCLNTVPGGREVCMEHQTSESLDQYSTHSGCKMYSQ